MKLALSIAVLSVLLAACGEKPQALGAVSKDEAAYKGTGKSFVAGGWKQGDRISWESQLKARMQRGQNDYSRMN